MPKRRDGIMTVRIPTDEKGMLQIIADNLDITLSDVVVKAARDFIAANPGALKKAAAKPRTAKPQTAKTQKTPSKSSTSKSAKGRGR